MGKIWHSNFNETAFDVYQIKLLENHFSYIISANGAAIVVDPSEGQPILDCLNENNLSLEACLITHHDKSHSGSASYLKEKTDCQIIGPRHLKYTMVDQDTTEGDELGIGPFNIYVYTSPGFEEDHLLYYFPECNVLFCGDILSLSGCGFMAQGNEHQYFNSIQRIKKFPKKTLLFVGKNLVEQNLAFAQSIDPQIISEDKKTFRTLEDEITLNPFLQANSPETLSELQKAREEFNS